MQNNTETANAGKSKAATKSRSVRVILDGEDYLNFHHIAGRLCFPEKMSDRMEEEEILRVALKMLRKEVDRRIAQGDQFIDSESLC